MKVSTKLKAAFGRFLLLTAFLCISLSAKAVDWIDLQLDTEYTLVDFKSFYGKFTASKTGIVSVSFTGGASAPKPCLDEKLEQSVSYASYSFGYDFKVVEGTVYYLADDWIQQGGVMTLSMADGVVFKEASPAAGSLLDLGGGAQINILFDKAVSVEDGVLVSGNYVDSLEVHASGNAVTSELRTVLYAMVNKGQAKPGDKLTVKLEGVRAAIDESVRYGEDGVYTIDYICPDIPVSLESESVLSKFLSYWLPTDESGLMTMTFSGALDPTSAKVVFCYGNAEGAVGEYYEETIPYTVDGNKLIIDFRGKVRDPKSMIKSGYVYSVCMLKVLSVRDAKGNYAYTPYSGSLGSFTYEIPFAMANGKYAVEFTPKAGSDLADYNEVEVYLSGADNVYYTGLQVAYTDGTGRHTVDLTEAEYSLVKDGDENTYTIPVQEAWKTASDVVVSLRDFVSKTGESNGSEAKYNAFVVTGVNPVSGSTVGYLNGTDVIDVTTNRSKLIKNFVYEIHDLNAETADDYILKSMGYLTPDADSLHWTAQAYGDYRFYTGHQYSFVFKAYNTVSLQGTPFGMDSIVINGGTTPYEYSDVQFESITPAEGSVITDVSQNCFTITFDGLVSLPADLNFINLGQGLTMPFDSIVNDVDTDEVAYRWKLYVAPSYLESHPGALSLTVVATDERGRRVQGNQGEEESTYFNFAYTNKIGVPELTCLYPVQGQSVSEISYVILSCTDGINDAYSGAKLELKNALTGETVATVTKVEPVYEITDENAPGYWDQVPTQMTLTFDKTVTAGGRYYMTIPDNYFYLGATADYNSAELTISVVIENNTVSAATAVTADPADGSTVTSLKDIVLTFTNESVAGPDWNLESSVQVLDANDNVVSGVTLDYGTGYNQVNVTLKNEITADGVYRIVFPADAFLFGEDGNTSSTAFTLTYSIGAATETEKTPVSANPADGSKVTSLNQIELTFTGESMAGECPDNMDVIEVKDAEGNVVTTATTELGLLWNQVVVTLAQPISADGVYTIYFTEGKFDLGDDFTPRHSSAFTLTYYIGVDPTGINGIAADKAAAVRVYNLQGVCVLRAADAAAVKALPAGVYVINGVKTVIR